MSSRHGVKAGILVINIPPLWQNNDLSQGFSLIDLVVLSLFVIIIHQFK